MKRNALEASLQKYGNALFMTFMVMAVLPLIAYESEFNAPFKFAFTFLGIPILAASFYIYFRCLPTFRTKLSTLKGVTLTVLFAALVTLMSGGYVLLANAWGPGQHETRLDGQVVDKFVSSGRSSTSYLVTIRDANGKRTTLEVSRSDYAKLAEGQHYTSTWKVGWLGLLYR